jgi:hypothetical protein
VAMAGQYSSFQPSLTLAKNSRELRLPSRAKGLVGFAVRDWCD